MDALGAVDATYVNSVQSHPRNDRPDTMPMIPWPRFVEIVRSHQRFVLTTHIRPDGDALGSELAMAAILEALGKDVRVCNAFAVPPNLRFLDPQRKLAQLGVDVSAEQLADREVLIVLDTTAWAQLGAMADVIKRTKAVKVVLDHHLSGDDLGAELFKDADAEATGRLVVEAADQLGVPLTPRDRPARVCRPGHRHRLVPLRVDHGRHAAAGRAAGRSRAPRRTNSTRSSTRTTRHARLQLIGRALARSQTELGGRLIYTWLEQADFAATGAVPSDSEDIINMTLSVGGTEVAVILVEQPTGGFKVSLRSRCEVDCSRVAEQFGGGGHSKAAGAFFDEPLESARQKILDAVRAAMQCNRRRTPIETREQSCQN